MQPDQTLTDALHALEARRAAATDTGDVATLQELYAPDMAFIHFRGKRQTRDDYIAEVAGNPRGIAFGAMTIQLAGDVAIMTGTHDITRRSPTGETRVINTFATRVVQQSADGWRYIFIQVAPVAV